MSLKLKAGEFYGETSQALAADGFRFTEKAYPSFIQIPKHSHELSHFCFVLSGNYREQIEKKIDERSPTSLIYYPPDVSHAEKHHSNGKHFMVEIDYKRQERVRDYGVNLNEPLALSNLEALWLAGRMYREFCQRDAFSPQALESITTELLIFASRQQLRKSERKRPIWLQKTVDILHENFTESLTLNDLADFVGVHPTHLARVFRQFEKCTIGDYIRRIRIENARQKIIGSKESLVEIALNTGFSDQTHFNRTFKKVTGMTPTEFRRIFRQS
jgi:AraC family transcriptional regulator